MKKIKHLEDIKSLKGAASRSARRRVARANGEFRRSRKPPRTLAAVMEQNRTDVVRCYTNAKLLGEQGFPVFPAEGKIPMLHGWQKLATTDPEQIAEWWLRKYPGANIGILTENLIVIDIDPRNGGDRTFADLIARYGAPPKTCVVRTGGGGWHHIYRSPEGAAIKSSTGTEDRGVGPGFDVKTGRGSYIITVGSRHPDTGKLYDWEPSLDPISVPPAVLTGPWLELIHKKSARGPQRAAGPPLKSRRLMSARERFFETRIVAKFKNGTRRTTSDEKTTVSKIAGCCPAHSDEHPSAWAALRRDGSIFLGCSAGCLFDDLCKAFGVTEADLRAPEPSKAELDRLGRKLLKSEKAAKPRDCDASTKFVTAHKTFVFSEPSQVSPYAQKGCDGVTVQQGGTNTHSALSPDDYEATVTRLARLTCSEYEKVRKSEAKRLDWRTQILDKEVNAHRRGEDIITEGDALRDLGIVDNEPWPRPVANGARLLDAILAILRKYVVADRHYLVAAALWVAFTYLINEPGIEVSPRLGIVSPEMRCGKTRALEVITLLVFRSLTASNLSASVIFRVFDIAPMTLLLDEADALFGRGKGGEGANEDLRGIVNSGHTRANAFVLRNVPTATPGEWKPQKFSTWGAMVTASIGHLPATWTDRSIEFHLRRKLKSDVVSRLRRSDHAAHERIAVLGQKLKRWTNDNAARIVADLAAGRTKMPEAIESDRALDNWEALFAIADAAGGHWPMLARNAAVQIESRADEGGSLRVRLLQDIRAIFKAAGEPSFCTSGFICGKLVAQSDGPWATSGVRSQGLNQNRLAYLLKQFGIEPRTGRGVEDGNRVNAKGYYRSDFDDAFARYLKPDKDAADDKSDTASTPAQPKKRARANMSPPAGVSHRHNSSLRMRKTVTLREKRAFSEPSQTGLNRHKPDERSSA